MKASVIIVGLLLGACTTVPQPESTADGLAKLVKTDRWGTRTCYPNTGAAWPDLLPRGALPWGLGRELDMQRRDQETQDVAQCWYSHRLLSLKEDSLFPLAPGSEVYRFTWIPSFEGTTVIRVERREKVYSLHVKVEGRDEGPTPMDKRILLTPSQWQALQQRLEQARFWTLDRFPRALPLAHSDGSYWLFEGARNGSYRALDIDTPNPEGRARDFYNLGAFLLELSGIPMTEGSPY